MGATERSSDADGTIGWFLVRAWELLVGEGCIRHVSIVKRSHEKQRPRTFSRANSAPLSMLSTRLGLLRRFLLSILFEP